MFCILVLEKYHANMTSSSQRIIIVICGITKAEVCAALKMVPRAGNTTSCARDGAIPMQTITSDQLVELAHYSSIPRVFVSAETHPSKSNLLCWNCGLAFSGTPRFIALERSQTRAGEWNINGNFCSWACAGTYIVEHYDDHKKWTLLQNLAVVRAQIERRDVVRVKLAPNRLRMSLYSGEGGLTQQQYSDEVAQCDAGYGSQYGQVE